MVLAPTPLTPISVIGIETNGDLRVVAEIGDDHAGCEIGVTPRSEMSRRS